MDATILSKSGDTAQLHVVDNRGNDHTVTVDTDCRVEYHETDAYPRDPTERTPATNELLRQVQQFARYIFAEQTTNQELLLGRHPDLVDTVVGILDTYSAEEFEELFDPVRLQLSRHAEADDEPSTSTDDGEDGSFVYYCGLLDVDVSASAGATELQQFFDALGGAFVENQFASMFGGKSSTGADFFSDVGQVANSRGYDLSELVELTLTGTYPCRFDPETGEEVFVSDATIDDPLIAAVELPPFDPGTPEEFKHAIQHHLLCQIRDCYIGMGLEPPEYVKLQGPGFAELTQRYRLLDVYEPYHDPDATVSVWDPSELLAD
ncbi:hypothetical protein [Halopiger goleimassiliensis]|uniref:hypothetical protein n=1 Tax=Halopiger goleimassiliensis TaxID=1293048 RepID=UPI000677BC02|nr:hypothetical protein [Halopiger goleimassiliensis]